MSEQQGGEGSLQARLEARQAETRANLANAIWTGLKIGVNVVTLKFIWGRFLEHGGSQEELMTYKPEDYDRSPESP